MNVIFDPSLVLYLPLYGLDGSSFASKDAYGHTCAVTGALWRPNGRYLDATDDRLDVANNPALQPTESTVIVWFKCTADSSAYRDLITSTTDSNGNNQAYHLRINQTTGVLYGRSGNGTANASLSGVGDLTAATEFSMATMTLDNTHISLFLNGEINGTPVARVAGVHTDTNPIRIGNMYGAFGGTIGEILVYNRPLTAQEIQHNYLATKWRYR